MAALGSSPALDRGLEPAGTALVEVGHDDSGDGKRLGSGLGVLALGFPAPGPEGRLQHKGSALAALAGAGVAVTPAAGCDRASAAQLTRVLQSLPVSSGVSHQLRLFCF